MKLLRNLSKSTQLKRSNLSEYKIQLDEIPSKKHVVVAGDRLEKAAKVVKVHSYEKITTFDEVILNSILLLP